MKNTILQRSVAAIRDWLLALPRRRKRTLLACADFAILWGLLWLGMSIRYGSLYTPRDWTVDLLLIVAPLLTIVTMAYAGLYRLVTRYLGATGHRRIIFSVALSVLVWSLLVFMSGQNGIPRTLIVLYAVLGAAVLISLRQSIAWLLSNHIQVKELSANVSPHAVLIYGAGHWGVQLSRALSSVPAFELVGFCDRSPSLWGQYVNDLRVYRPDRLASVIDRFGVSQVLLADPSEDREETRRIMKELEALPVEVKIMPSLQDIASGKVRLTDLRSIDVLDLLGREAIPPLPDLLSRNAKGKNVLITGAGGSVGSEIARQISRLDPRQLVLLDVSEVSLYNIDIELRDAQRSEPTIGAPRISTVLGSVLDRQLMLDTLKRYDIDVIYHAAAYKHVPLVQHNIEIGIENNTFGTAIVAAAAIDCDVELMVLISTDKAVRPTNVMGASKRLAELALKAAATRHSSTKFTMVRFGNVLDSSGSVVRRFREQIREGGPVTVTHSEVTRYFMSITEAAQLVIQAGAMAESGETFVLDMGDPIKVDDLARLMIRLSGREVRDAGNPGGDIEISYIGLRPGEKLYEELLISGNISATEHPRIMRMIEPPTDAFEIEREFEQLRAAVRSRDGDLIQAILKRVVEGYEIADDLPRGDPGSGGWEIPREPRTLH